MVEVNKNGIATFTFRHCADSQVYLVGDFNEWQKEHLPMRQTSDGVWQLMLRLPPGSYQFRYYSSGKWFTDYAAFGIKENELGAWNSLLHIPHEETDITQLFAPPGHLRRRAPTPAAEIV